MSRFKCHILITVLIIMMVFNSVLTLAEPLNELNSQELAISLVIDTSGSMNTTDPQRLREAVANVFIDQLNNEDYLGIITFNSVVDLVIPMGELKDAETREAIKEKLGPNIQGNANTDYMAALEKANEELNNLYNPNLRKIIIFLTDGEPDPDMVINNPSLMPDYMDELWSTVEKLKTNKYPVYSIGFSDGIDVEILNKIASDTKGDVRIFKDSNDLDINLVQVLKSREIIVEELLAPVDFSKNNSSLMPSISTDFWLKPEGYRNGDTEKVSASLNIGSNRISSGLNLLVDKFDLIINYDDGQIINIHLHDKGSSEHGDIIANDGIWSNEIVFDKNGKAEVILVSSGKYKGEDFVLEKTIGEFLVAEPGNIIASYNQEQNWLSKGEALNISILFHNQSDFKERVNLSTDTRVGQLLQEQIELEPNSKSDITIKIDLNDNLENISHKLSLRIEPQYSRTTINQEVFDFDIEVVSYFESLRRKFEASSIIIIPLLLIFLGLPLLIFLFGMLLYIVLVKSKLKVKGTLIYWDEKNNEYSINLSQLNKEEIVISYKPTQVCDLYIENTRYKYNIVIRSEIIKKRMKFILGWLGLITRREMVEYIIYCTKPGIILYEGDIYTQMNLYNNNKFSSGGFGFKYIRENSKWAKEVNEGKNILEGRI